jgi:chromosome segregation ATPase
MTDKYTADSPEIKQHPQFFHTDTSAHYIALLMNQAYEEGLKNGRQVITYDNCGHIEAGVDEEIKGLEHNLQASLDRERKILKELSDAEEEVENWKSSENVCDEQYELLLKENQELKEQVRFLGSIPDKDEIWACKAENENLKEQKTIIENAHHKTLKENVELTQKIENLEMAVMRDYSTEANNLIVQRFAGWGSLSDSEDY